MKHVFLVLLVSATVIQITSDTNIQHIDSSRASLHTIQDLSELILALKREDYVWVGVKAIDVYEASYGYSESFITKFTLHRIQDLLKKIYPVYIYVYPEKAPKNSTLSKIPEAVDGILQMDYVKGATQIYKVVENPLFKGVSSMFL